MKKMMAGLTTGLIVAGLLGVPLQAEAQSSLESPGSPSGETAGADRDFFFQRPHFSVSLRGGAFMPRAEGQFYDSTFERFTMDRGDLNTFTGGADLGIWMGNHVEVFGSVDMASVTQDSEYRDWVEETDLGELPITQTTRLRYGPSVSLGVKGFPLGRGEQISQFIWVPADWSPYLSAGVGAIGYQVEQWGDWVVESGEDIGLIFSDEFNHEDVTFMSFIGGGLEVTLRPRLGFILDTRYILGEDRMRGDYREFDRPLDLSGLRVTAGLSFRL